MGFMKQLSGADPEQIATHVSAAQKAWDEGKLAYVYKLRALASGDAAASTDTIDQLLRIGWELHSSALAYNQTGMNTEVAMWTFIRPDAART